MGQKDFDPWPNGHSRRPGPSAIQRCTLAPRRRPPGRLRRCLCCPCPWPPVALRPGTQGMWRGERAISRAETQTRIWVWLKMNELGQTAGFCLWYHFFEPQPYECPGKHQDTLWVSIHGFKMVRTDFVHPHWFWVDVSYCLGCPLKDYT